MRLVRFGPAGQERPGIVDGDGAVRDAGGLVTDWSGDTLDAVRRLAQVDLARLPEVPGDARLGCPVAAPGKIVCIGLNYADHAAETGFDPPPEPPVFLKSPTALCGPADPIVLPRTANAVDWEVELAVIVGRTARDIRPEEAATHIAGFAVANDVTDRGWQFERGGQWSKGKSADTFATLGPWLVTPDELPASLDLRIWLRKNGRTRQDSQTGALLFPVDHIVAHLSEFMTLLPGDVILTGTPAGVAYNKPSPDYLQPGDVVTCGIDGLGAQSCEVHGPQDTR